MNQPDSSKRRAGWVFAIVGAGGVVRVVLEAFAVVAGVSQARTDLLDMIIINAFLTWILANPAPPPPPGVVLASLRLILADGAVTTRDLPEQREAVGGRPS